MIVSIEQHVDWVCNCISWMQNTKLSTIEATHEAELEWAQHTQQLAGMTVLPGVDSWYTGANVPGKPRIFMVYLGGLKTYRDICDAIANSGYSGFIKQ